MEHFLTLLSISFVLPDHVKITGLIVELGDPSKYIARNSLTILDAPTSILWKQSSILPISHKEWTTRGNGCEGGRKGGVGELSDMMSALEGGGHGKADIVREVA